MREALLILALWAVFAALHLIPSDRRIRAACVRRLGLPLFHALYSLLSLAVFVPLFAYYLAHRHAGPMGWASAGPYVVAKYLNYAVMGLAFALLFGAFAPATRRAWRAAVDEGAAPGGLVAVTRHPALVGVALYGVAHLLVNGFASDVAFFGGWILLGGIGVAHADRRLAREHAEFKRVLDATSIVPFAAILRGRAGLRLADLPWGAIMLGIATAALIRTHHGALVAAITPG
ncbi:MAG: hypothetical protein KC466_14895 [Myxococcales bacterium]|nr:hypothetical protein [Myxococcales bacterium]